MNDMILSLNLTTWLMKINGTKKTKEFEFGKLLYIQKENVKQQSCNNLKVHRAYVVPMAPLLCELHCHGQEQDLCHLRQHPVQCLLVSPSQPLLQQ